MKKLLSTALLMTSLFGSVNAHALPVVDAGNIVQSTISAVQNGLTALSTAAIEAKTAVMEAWDKSAWTQQLKGLWESLQKAQQQINEIVGLRDDLMNTLSGARDIGASVLSTNSSSTTNLDYHYADQLPSSYLVGQAFIGKAAGNNSSTIRDTWKVAGDLTSYNVEQLSKSAAETNANQIAVIQAMAQEAYAQARLRIDIIAALEAKILNATAAVNSKSVAASPGQTAWQVNTPAISNQHSVSSVATGATPNQYDGYGNLTVAGTLGLPSSTSELSWSSAGTSTTIGGASDATSASAAPSQNRNDLKYIADLQAQIQVQQALLQNEQNKLAALAILQQSQRDSYEQRKKEIADYAVNKKGNEVITALGLVVGQKLSYSTIASWYTTTQ